MTTGLSMKRCLFFVAVLASGAAKSLPADDWPQWRGLNRDGTWSETDVLDRFAAPQLAVKWRAKIGSGYSGPTMADGRVFVTDRLVEPKQVERVLAFDFATGKPLWTHAYDCPYVNVGYQAGPRASVTLDGGRAYSLGTMGHLFCFDAADGKVLWKHDLNQEYKIEMPIWGIAGSPVVEGNLLIAQIGGQRACVVAFDKLTGGEQWKALDDQASYSAPIVIDQAGRRVLVCLTGDRLVGLGTSTGELLWEQEFKPTRMVISAATPVVDQDRVLVTSFYDGSMLTKLGADRPTAQLLWRRRGPDEQKTEGLHSIISTPVLAGEFIYGVDSYGQLRCLDAKTGERLWESLEATPKARWSTVHFVRNGDRYWLFNERGKLIIARLTPQGYQEISRSQLISPTTDQLPQRGGVCWAHPAFAGRHVLQRNDEELVAVSLIPGEN